VPDHLVKFGAEYIYHTFIPETLMFVDTDIDYDGSGHTERFEFGNGGKNYFGHDISLYAEDDISLGERLTVNPGVHMSLFLTEGKPYWGFQPRLSAKYSFMNGFSMKAGYARMAQYVHLLCSAQVSLPIDLWVPITKDIRPVTSDQFSAGVYYDGIKGWEFSVEGYYKDMRNILEYKDGTFVISTSKDWERNVEMGQGRAMGLELFVQKTAGKATGWLAYTLAKSERRFPDGTINMGEWFPYKYDRRHSLDISLNYAFTRNVEANATWSFASGGTTTLYTRTTAVQTPDGNTTDADYVAHRNNYRLPPSHRLNVGVSLHHPHKRHGEGIWNLSVYNVYNRMNPNFVYLQYKTVQDEDSGVSGTYLTMTKITLLPILPSISYTYKF
jgi:outer membrane receptor for ferrienterochelin and colicin